MRIARLFWGGLCIAVSAALRKFDSVETADLIRMADFAKWVIAGEEELPFHHISQIVALSEIYPEDLVRRAIEDAFHFNAFSCDCIANLSEQRSRQVQEPGALHLTRNRDLLEMTIKRPDLSIYDIGEEK